jgi:hypothetical protein
MLAHTLGNPFNVQKIKEICEKYNLWLIEDSCDALGSKFAALKAARIVILIPKRKPVTCFFIIIFFMSYSFGFSVTPRFFEWWLVSTFEIKYFCQLLQPVNIL